MAGSRLGDFLQKIKAGESVQSPRELVYSRGEIVDLDVLVQAVNDGKCEKLQSLDFSGHGFSGKYPQSILMALCAAFVKRSQKKDRPDHENSLVLKLKETGLDGGSIDDITKLIAGCQFSKLEIDLSDNNLDDNAAIKIAEAIEKSNVKKIVLHLHHNKKLTDKGMIAILDAIDRKLAANPQLDLFNWEFGFTGSGHRENWTSKVGERVVFLVEKYRSRAPDVDRYRAKSGPVSSDQAWRIAKVVQEEVYRKTKAEYAEGGLKDRIYSIQADGTYRPGVSDKYKTFDEMCEGNRSTLDEMCAQPPYQNITDCDTDSLLGFFAGQEPRYSYIFFPDVARTIQASLQLRAEAYNISTPNDKKLSASLTQIILPGETFNSKLIQLLIDEGVRLEDNIIELLTQKIEKLRHDFFNPFHPSKYTDVDDIIKLEYMLEIVKKAKLTQDAMDKFKQENPAVDVLLNLDLLKPTRDQKALQQNFHEFLTAIPIKLPDHLTPERLGKILDEFTSLQAMPPFKKDIKNTSRLRSALVEAILAKITALDCENANELYDIAMKHTCFSHQDPVKRFFQFLEVEQTSSRKNLKQGYDAIPKKDSDEGLKKK